MTRLRLPVRIIAIGALVTIVASAPAGNVLAQNTDGIRIQVNGMKSDEGRLGCSLFKGPEGFPRERKSQFRGMYVPIHKGTGICDFNNVPAGTYAATVLDDTNSNGKMDFNKIGIPTKGYGFSNNAKPTVLPPGPPSFKKASFEYSGSGVKTVQIDIITH
jgi:uncharacterized protein (DUF2141 family)